MSHLLPFGGLAQTCPQEIDELVDEWAPEPLASPLSPEEQADLASVPVIVGPTGPKPKLASGKTVTNLASYNFTGLAGNEEIKASAIETLRKYGLGSCGPPGFYGTQGECTISVSHSPNFLPFPRRSTLSSRRDFSAVFVPLRRGRRGYPSCVGSCRFCRRRCDELAYGECNLYVYDNTLER